MESTIFRRVSLDSMWTPHGLYVDSAWSPCGLYVDCRKYSHGLPLKSMESSWSPWKPVGECKVLHNFAGNHLSSVSRRTWQQIKQALPKSQQGMFFLFCLFVFCFG